MVFAVAGCAHRQAASKPDRTAAAGSPAAYGGNKTCNNDSQCGDRQICVKGNCTDISKGAVVEVPECTELRVHFMLNESSISPDDKPALERSARCLKADRQIRVTVQGNADERGTEEYNLSLGDKRAAAVASYLEALGVPHDQLKTVSYGKENPLCTEHDEACWAKNRRALVKPDQK